jgi:hypothetical protein
MIAAEIKSVVDKLADAARVLSTANADDKAEVFRHDRHCGLWARCRGVTGSGALAVLGRGR